MYSELREESGSVETVSDFVFLGSKITALTLVDHQHFLSIYVFLLHTVIGPQVQGVGSQSTDSAIIISSFVDTAFIPQIIIFF